MEFRTLFRVKKNILNNFVYRVRKRILHYYKILINRFVIIPIILFALNYLGY